MRITFVVSGLRTGGAEMMLLRLCSYLDPHRFISSVISLSDRGSVGRSFEALGVPVYTLDIPPGHPSLAGLFRLRKLILNLRPDVVQGWMYHGNLAASLAAGRRPVVWGIRQSLYDLKKERPLTRWVIRLGALLSRRCRGIIYNSQASARQHEAFGFDSSRTRVIPNGFDTDLFRPDEECRVSVRRGLGLGDNVILVGLIGRYHPMKDHRTFLTAAALLGKKFPDVYFLLAGRNMDMGNATLRGIIEELGLSGRVLLLGERTDIPQLNVALDVASSASAWGEGFANVVAEAMSCGVPCVVTDVGDSAWIVGDTGRVAPPNDPSALAKALEGLVEAGCEGRQALGLRARLRVIENWSLGSVVKKYEDLYERVAAEMGA